MEHQKTLDLLNETSSSKYFTSTWNIVNNVEIIQHLLSVSQIIIDDAEGLDLVISMCKLIEYSLNYFCTTDSLLFYSKD